MALDSSMLISRTVLESELPGSLRNTFLCLSLLGFNPGIGMAADLWPEFRGPGAQGISTATNIPVRWNAATNIAWKVAVPGKGWSSPIVADGKIYLTSAC